MSKSVAGLRYGLVGPRAKARARVVGRAFIRRIGVLYERIQVGDPCVGYAACP